MTFRKSKLTPKPAWSPKQKNLRKWYQALIAFRKAQPCWQPDPRHHLRAETLKPGVMKATGISNEHQLFMWVNFTKNPIQLKAPSDVEVSLFSGEAQWSGDAEIPSRYATDDPVHLPGESVIVMQNASLPQTAVY
ncbi:MAG: hypothetical protein ACOCTO_04095 [Marinilabiliaceae bacterium]